jgi:hypothetical protein
MRLLVPFLMVFAACGGERDPENSMRCGLQAIASGNRVLELFQAATTVMTEPPPGLRGTVPARVVGHGTAHALAAENPDGIVAGYEGEGFPAQPGFALALVDDSTEVFRGVLIFAADGPANYPQIGTMSGASSTIPLYAMRAPWGQISTPECPLFRVAPDTARG